MAEEQLDDRPKAEPRLPELWKPVIRDGIGRFAWNICTWSRGKAFRNPPAGAHEERVIWRLKQNAARQRRYKETRTQVKVQLYVAIVGGIGGLVNHFLRIEIDWKGIFKAFEPWWAQILGVLGALSVAGMLFYVRSRWPRLYSSLELAIAVLTLWNAVGAPAKTSITERGAKLAAGIYLFVRGLDNWTQAPRRIEEWNNKQATKNISELLVGESEQDLAYREQAKAFIAATANPDG